jgi:flavoprotein
MVVVLMKMVGKDAFI